MNVTIYHNLLLILHTTASFYPSNEFVRNIKWNVGIRLSTQKYGKVWKGGGGGQGRGLVTKGEFNEFSTRKDSKP